jgi:hypothetical protein
VWQWLRIASFSVTFGVVSHVSPEASPPVFKGGHFLKINWPIFCVHGACLNEPMYWNNNDTSGSMIPANATLLLLPADGKKIKTKTQMNER